MKILSAEFFISSKELKSCPKPDKPEYAFIGRSNVGKSSLINMLVNKTHLAKTSSTPGKTRLINHFLITSTPNNEQRTTNNESWYLVDLPGIGYAKTSKSTKEEFQKIIYNYLLKRKSLMTTFMLIDSRLTLQKIDAELIEWFGENNLPFTIILTKTDKLKPLQLERSITSLQKSLQESWEELPQIIISSSVTKSGKDDILSLIEQTNKIFSN